MLLSTLTLFHVSIVYNYDSRVTELTDFKYLKDTTR